MAGSCHCPRLSKYIRGARGPYVQRFQRDRPLNQDIQTKVDNAHSARADASVNLELGGYDLGERRDRGHGLAITAERKFRNYFPAGRAFECFRVTELVL